jgi:S-formylglutathione hydrolase FrmB
MAVATIQFKSPALERDATYIALIPDPAIVGPGPYPALVQLHGYTDDQTAWLYKSRLWEHAELYPMIVILPATHNGWWSNLGRPNNWEDYVVRDLIGHVQATLPVKPGPWAIGGLSMGGFGALRLGLKHPRVFNSIWAHSSAIFDPAKTEPIPFIWDDPQLTDQARAAYKVELSCYHWAEQLDKAGAPRISFDCGVDDFLIEHNRSFHTHLEQLGIPHTYNEHPGAHTWEYWDTHVVSALAQHAEVFGITKAKPPTW